MKCATGKKFYYFDAALDCIDLNSDKKQCHGAVLVKGNKIVSRGTNTQRGRVLKTNVCSTHAEIDCLNNLAQISKRRVLFEKRYYQRYKKLRYIHYPEGIGWSRTIEAM